MNKITHTPEQMLIISNINTMRNAITGNRMDFDNLHLYDVGTMTYDELFDMQCNLIPYYNEAINNL